jgi:hypothetical protein
MAQDAKSDLLFLVERDEFVGQQFLPAVKGSVPHNHIFWFSFAVTPLVGQRPDQMMFAFCR